MRRIWCMGLGVMVMGCAATVSTFAVKPTNMGTVGVGDMMEQVTQKVGPPQQVWPSMTTAEGHEQVVWEYASAGTSETTWRSAIQPTSPRVVLLEKQHHVAPLSESSYLIVFVDGRVSEIVSP